MKLQLSIIYSLTLTGNCDPVSETSQDYQSMCEAAENEVTELRTFRPTIHHEGYHKYYRFSFEKEGEYQCEITALIFDVASPAEVVYGTEQWEKCPLDQSSLLPAGPLYDINSPSGALKHLSFPHSECSPEVQNHLMVAHYKNDNAEMIKPSEVTETHIKIKVTEMSLFGLVRRWLKYKSKAQVLLFLRQLTKIKKLNVFLLSSNVVLDEVQEKQKDSIFIETSSHCVVLEEEKYSVSCDQENAHVQPDTYDFVRDYGPNFPPTFEIFLNNDVEELTVKVFKSTRRDASVWSRRVLLDGFSSSGQAPPGERLKAVRTRLIEGLNASVIRDLLDDMLHMNVLNDGEVESVKEGQTCTKDKASCLIDMVRKKGTSASEKFIYKLAERDPALYVTLGLHRQSVD
ncbi:caspase recruitment domain-containing protein 8-like [Acipenser ruthenus]|uniref:caspase recruitment domain-containing protein 8-like n=1 Tax=Acipenser ruthenus TaxID=7906 RepID=UPI002742663B|nr:caspase recruitment domain-containing protein 8-like [Acipenser ruthenus]